MLIFKARSLTDNTTEKVTSIKFLLKENTPAAHVTDVIFRTSSDKICSTDLCTSEIGVV